jgi:very-short-patch-repair endonuclease
MGAAERRLWTLLRRGSLGFRFRRQYAIGGYILDFYCPETKVAVEVDGDFHDREKDAARDAKLADMGIYTVRLATNELYPSAVPAADLVWKTCNDRRIREEPPP